MISPVIVCIAKYEKDYIEEFVRYHLNIGFEQIYLFDNEDIPTYQGILKEFDDKVIINHLPGKNYERLPQFEAIQRFVINYMWKPEITHVAHIDIDEFIVLKKHNNIKDFIKEYIFDGENGVMCGGIGINWRIFGNNNHIEKNKEPLTIRFTKRQQTGNLHVKTLFNKQFYGWFNNPHNIGVIDNNYPIKCTNGNIIDGPFNENMDFSVIQLNHYKCKTWKEFKYIRSRGRADRYDNPYFEEGEAKLLEEYNSFNLNEEEDLDACNFYKKILHASQYSETNDI
jgi:hypothetical protein